MPEVWHDYGTIAAAGSRVDAAGRDAPLAHDCLRAAQASGDLRVWALIDHARHDCFTVLHWQCRYRRLRREGGWSPRQRRSVGRTSAGWKSREIAPRQERVDGRPAPVRTACSPAPRRGDADGFLSSIAVICRRWSRSSRGESGTARRHSIDPPETFAAGVVSAARFDERRGPAVAWLLGIAEHKHIDSVGCGRAEADARGRLAPEAVTISDVDLE